MDPLQHAAPWLWSVSQVHRLLPLFVMPDLTDSSRPWMLMFSIKMIPFPSGRMALLANLMGMWIVVYGGNKDMTWFIYTDASSRLGHLTLGDLL
jgi:hypothetical protein